MLSSIKDQMRSIPIVVRLYRFINSIGRYLVILYDYHRFKKLERDNRFVADFQSAKFINEKKAQQHFDRHYIYHTAWAARTLKKVNPKKHIDISSSLYFNFLISAFIPIDFYDYRPINTQIENLTSRSCDLLNLPFEDDSIQSISCMHVVEHIGLGRYGDMLDPEGDIKAIKELRRVVTSGGHIIFVVPVGKPQVIFNAHRIYGYEMIITYFNDCQLNDFALVPDKNTEGSLILNAESDLVNRQEYGCGCFHFIKK